MHKHMQITEVSNLTKRHADNSGNHADLRPLKISATARSNSLSLKFLLITQHEGSLINTSKATKKFKLPNRERKMYKCHEPQESFTGCQPHFTTICVCRLGIANSSPFTRTTKRKEWKGSCLVIVVTTQAHDREI